MKNYKKKTISTVLIYNRNYRRTTGLTKYNVYKACQEYFDQNNTKQNESTCSGRTEKKKKPDSKTE